MTVNDLELVQLLATSRTLHRDHAEMGVATYQVLKKRGMQVPTVAYQYRTGPPVAKRGPDVETQCWIQYMMPCWTAYLRRPVHRIRAPCDGD